MLVLIADKFEQSGRDGLQALGCDIAYQPDLKDVSLSEAIGVAGVLTRRNIIVIFMSIELIMNAANINFIAFARYLQSTGNPNALAGQIFAVFVIVVAAAEAAIGLGIVIALYRNKETILLDEIDLLKW